MKNTILFILCILLAGLTGANAQTPCNAAFGWQAYANGNNLFNVNFTNNSTGATTSPSGTVYTTYTINYGDGSGVGNFGSTSSHNYPGAGTYTVTVVVHSYDSSSAGITQICTDTETGVVTVASSPCASTFTAQSNGSGSYTFTATNPAGTPGMTYSWNFGDNTSGTGNPVTHVYNTGGNFTVTLTSTGGGCSYTNMTSLNNSTSSFNCSSATADFSSSISNSDVYFSNLSSGNQGNNNLYSVGTWNFGDGSTVTAAYNVSHSYAAVGTYTVSLVNTWTDSLTSTAICSKTASHTITISTLSPPPPNLISGYIYFDTLNSSTLYPGSTKVWLIAHDATANTLTAIDSLELPMFGQMYEFDNVPAGDYLVKAAAQNQTPGTTGWVPTYHFSSPYWVNATVISHNGNSTTGKDINLIAGTVTAGPGFIGGNISAGAGKGTGTGIQGMMVYLRGSNDQLIKSTVTDADGDYSFSDIPTGTYSVYPEAINYTTIPYNAVNVTSGQANVSAIDFERNETQIKPKTVTGIAKITAKDGLKIYPNPAKNLITIENQNGLFNQVKIMNAVGQLLKEVNLKTGLNKVDIAEMNAGIYYLLISSKEGSRSLKFVKQ